jgi:hypothetical protein
MFLNSKQVKPGFFDPKNADTRLPARSKMLSLYSFMCGKTDVERFALWVDQLTTHGSALVAEEAQLSGTRHALQPSAGCERRLRRKRWKSTQPPVVGGNP